MRENVGNGWVERGPCKATEYGDLPRSVPKEWHEPFDWRDDYSEESFP